MNVCKNNAPLLREGRETGAERPILWEPREADRDEANVSRFLAWLEAERGLRFSGYSDLWRWSVTDLEGFWDAVSRFHAVRWNTPPTAILTDASMPGAQWFPGARINYAEELLRRSCDADPALIHIGEDLQLVGIAAAELRDGAGALAAVLREEGVGPGDVVAGYLPNIPEAVIGLLATASIGAIWACCSPDFGTAGALDRLGQVKPKVLIAVDGYEFNGTIFDRRDTVRDLASAMTSLRKTVVIHHGDGPAEDLGLPAEVSFAKATSDARTLEFEPVPFGHPLWVLFTSGSTGKPKGIVHSHGGIVIEHLKALGLCLDLRSSDRFFYYTSTSWMAWNFIVGGLLNGATPVLYNGAPTHCGPDRLWRVLAETGTTVAGLGSAYVMGCSGTDVELSDVDLSRLRTVIPTGSPLSDSGWRWLGDRLPPRVRIDSVCGGTDVCSGFFGGSPLLPVRLGEISCRWLGVDAQAYDESGSPVVDEVGEFVLTQPMPSMPIELWGDDGELYRSTYFDMYPGIWRQGDWISIAHDGAVTVSGRSDATLNRGGVRLGSGEIYAVVESMPEIADSLVIGAEMPEGSYMMVLYVVPATGCELDENLRQALRERLRTRLSPRHVPDEIITAPAIPRTRTGKKLEVPVKRLLQGADPRKAVALSAIDFPRVFEWFVRDTEKRRERP